MSDALNAASAIASTSTSRMAGQSTSGTVSSLNSGKSISTRASGGKSWLHQVGADAGR
ncbi:MAG: hypothetical protein WDM96_10240 [Lacunisphaera sp.]